MPSPFYVPGADIYGGAIAARRDAQNDFTTRLGQLYAGGDQKAGQVLGGMAPEKLDAIRTAMEKLPGTEQAKVAQRIDLLKKWHLAISQEPDESTRALMYNQMLAQAREAGADISHIAQQYDPQSLKSQMTHLLSWDEAMAVNNEARLADQAQKEGISAQERDFLAFGDATSQQWQDLFSKRYAPRIAQNGAVQTQLIPDETLNKAIKAGVFIPLDWVNADQAKRIREAQGKTTTTTTATPAPLPGDLSPEAAAAAGLGGIAGSSVTQVAGMKTPEQLQRESEQRAEDRRKAEEQRKLDQENKAKQDQLKKDIDSATVFYQSTIDKFNELMGLVSNMNPLEAIYSEKLTKARSIIGRLLTDIKNPKMADLGAITPSDLALLAGFVPDLEGASAQRFDKSKAIIPLQQGLQYVKDKADGFYASKGVPNPLGNKAASQGSKDFSHLWTKKP